MKKEFDYLVVGAGLYGSVFAHEMTKKNKKIGSTPFVRNRL